MYKTEMENTYPVAEANGNRHALYCIPCKPNITCHHMGLRDKKKTTTLQNSISQNYGKVSQNHSQKG